MGTVEIVVGIFCVASLIVCMVAMYKAIKTTSPHVDSVDRIANLQSWEFVRGLNRDGTKK